jgi:hypothetical protein
MADPHNAAWEEAQASVPQDVEVFYTLELRHPAFLENEVEVAVRVVAETPDDQLFRIEDGAPLNGGEMAKFLAVPFHSERPEMAEGQMPESRVTVDNVNRELVPKVEEAVKVRADLICVYREYRSDDRDEPCYGPVEFVMRKVSVKGTSITGVAQLDDLANSKFPRRVYSVSQFPGLAGG